MWKHGDLILTPAHPYIPQVSSDAFTIVDAASHETYNFHLEADFVVSHEYGRDFFFYFSNRTQGRMIHSTYQLSYIQ